MLSGRLQYLLCPVARANARGTSLDEFAPSTRTADPIWTERRRSTQSNDGNVVTSMPERSRNGTWHVFHLEPKLLPRSRRGKRHSTRLYERDTTRSVALSLAFSDMDTYIQVVGSNPG